MPEAERLVRERTHAQITSRSWISQGQRTALVFNEGKDWYIADAEGPGFQRALYAQRRYERTVSARSAVHIRSSAESASSRRRSSSAIAVISR